MNKNNGFHVVVKLTVAVIGICSIVSALLLQSTVTDGKKGTVLTIISVAAVLMLLLEDFLLRGQTKRYIAKMSTSISKTERDSLLNFPAPAIIIDDEESVVWYNRQFGQNVYSDEEAYGIKLSDMMNIDLDKVFTPDGDLVCVNAHFYMAKAIHTDAEGRLSMVYFNDVTDYTELEYDTRMSHYTVVIITIDNFDELMSNIRESEKAHVVVEIEKLIEDFLDNTTAVSKKVSSDKFYVFMEERDLAPIIEGRFKILEQARAITVTDRTNLTLSIGVGRDGATPAESEKDAKQALEMCLGRGGDQAAVKQDGEFAFFGGVSSAPDRNSKTRIRMIAKAMLELICSHEKILIMGHRHGDLDSVGSATGLCCAVKKLVHEAHVVVDPDDNLAKPLIRYINDNELSDYYISPQQALEQIDDSTLLFVVDTHNPAIVESSELLERAKNVVVIDHHRRMVNGIDPTIMSFLEPNASSTSEQVTELIEYFGEDSNISVPVSEALLAGIMLDTKNFVMKTGVSTFEAAAFLKKKGADTIVVKKMFANTIETYHQKSALINSAVIYRHCAVAQTDKNFSDIRIAASQAADELLGITGVDASFVMYVIGETVHISARSLGAFNVQIVMEKLGGGGHLTMAATQLKGMSLTEASERLKSAIDEFIIENAG